MLALRRSVRFVLATAVVATSLGLSAGSAAAAGQPDLQLTITPAAQTLNPPSSATWTVRWSGGSGRYTIEFQFDEDLNKDCSDGVAYAVCKSVTTSSGSWTFSHSFGVPCPNRSVVTFWQQALPYNSSGLPQGDTKESHVSYAVRTSCPS